MHNELLLQPARRLVKAITVNTRLFGILMLMLGVAHHLPAAAPATSSLKFTEAYTEKIVCDKGSGTVTCAKIGRDQFAITAHVPLAGVDISAFTYTNVIVVNLGGLHLTNQLGFDPRFVPGKKSAKMTRITRDADNKTLTSYLLSATWNDSMLKVTVVGRIIDVTLFTAQPLVAPSLAGTPSGPVSGTIDGFVSLGDAMAEFNGVPFDGKAVTREKTGKDGTPFTVSKVTVKKSKS